VRKKEILANQLERIFKVNVKNVNISTKNIIKIRVVKLLNNSYCYDI